MKRERRSFSPVDRRSGVTQVVLQVVFITVARAVPPRYPLLRMDQLDRAPVVFNPADVMTRRTPDRPGELVSLGIILVSGQGRVDS